MLLSFSDECVYILLDALVRFIFNEVTSVAVDQSSSQSQEW